MASINATTSSGIIATADNTGTLQLQSAGTTVMTITPTGVTTQVGAPAFSAFMTTSQNIPTGTVTKLIFNAEDYDTNSNFDPTTNYRFTPTVAGYYQLSAGAFASVGTAARFGVVIYKNGTESGWNFAGGVTSSGGGSTTLSSLFYANGTTDYFEVYVVQDSGVSVTVNNLSFLTWFRGFLARSA
jgi:hypothetical protein